jgi:hypothetical protein
MTSLELEQQFPRLFEPIACQSYSDAERYADRVAAKTGLTVRVASWASEAGIRQIEYRDPASLFRLIVEISSENNRGSEPFYLFRCSAERSDAKFKLLSSHAFRAKPLAFQREARELVSRLRSLRVDNSGRISGQLIKWDDHKRYGVIECVPGASVHLHASQLPAGVTVAPNDWLSFNVAGSADRKKAVNVSKCCCR